MEQSNITGTFEVVKPLKAEELLPDNLKKSENSVLQPATAVKQMDDKTRDYLRDTVDLLLESKMKELETESLKRGERNLEDVGRLLLQPHHSTFQHPPILPELFSANGDQNATIWMRDFENDALLNNWDDAWKIHWFPKVLTSQANTWYKLYLGSLTTEERRRLAFDTIKRAFLAAFPTQNDWFFDWNEIAYPRSPDETLDTYYYRLRNAYMRKKPLAPLDEEFIATFLRGLSPELRSLLLHQNYTNRTIEEILRKAKQLEPTLVTRSRLRDANLRTTTYYSEASEDYPQFEDHSYVQKIEREVSTLTQEVNKMAQMLSSVLVAQTSTKQTNSSQATTQMHSNSIPFNSRSYNDRRKSQREFPPKNKRESYRTSDGVVICFNCEKRGHFARNCPELQKQNASTPVTQNVIANLNPTNITGVKTPVSVQHLK